MALKDAINEIRKYISYIQTRASVVEVSLLERLVETHGVPEENARAVYNEIIDVVIGMGRKIFEDLVVDLDLDRTPKETLDKILEKKNGDS